MKDPGDGWFKLCKLSPPVFQNLLRQVTEEYEKVLCEKNQLAEENERLRCSKAFSRQKHSFSRERCAKDVHNQFGLSVLPVLVPSAQEPSSPRSLQSFNALELEQMESANKSALKASVQFDQPELPVEALAFDNLRISAASAMVSVDEPIGRTMFSRVASDPMANVRLAEVWTKEWRSSCQGNVWLQSGLSGTFDDTKNNRRPSASSTADDMADFRALTGDVRRSNSCVQHLVLHPTGCPHFFWVMLQCVLICYDAVTIPLVAFDMPQTTFSTALGFSTAIFWTIDMFLQALVGFHREGVIEVRPSYTLIRYLREDFAFDMVMNALDWMIIILSASETAGASGFLRMVKASKIYRLVRLLRMVKLWGALSLVLDSLRSQLVVVLARLGRLLAFLLAVVHYISCSWCYLGMSNDAGETWITAKGLTGAPHVELYIWGLHWALTQFTPATMDIAPQNFRERAFAILIVLVALLIFSSLLSSITSTMTNLRNMNSEMLKDESRIREYLQGRKVSLDLGNRIWQCFRQSQRNKMKRRVFESEVNFFAKMPESLRMELRVDAYLPVATVHPLFRTLHVRDESAVVLICHRAMSEICFQPGGEVYLEGSEATQVLIVQSGELKFRTSQDVRSAPVLPGSWACEVALWCKWVHAGRLKAVSMTDIVVMNAAKFHGVAETRAIMGLRKYAHLFLEEVRAGDCDEISSYRYLERSRQDATVLVQKAFGNERGTEVGKGSGKMLRSLISFAPRS